jgi:hypothetical protein
MSDLVLSSKQNVEDFVTGCSFYATGGGPSGYGLPLLLDDLAKVGEIRISDPADIRDDSWVCTPFLMGSPAPKTNVALAKMASLGLTKRITTATRMQMLAALELERYACVDVEAFVSVELSGAATSGAINAGMALGKKVVNGDYAGRGIPEITMLTTYLANKPAHPITYVDEWGNITIIKKVIDHHMAELLGKMISVAAFGMIGGAGFLMRGKEMKEVIVPNTLSECFLAGQTIHNAVANKRDPAEALAKAAKGWVLFRGKVVKREWEDKEGYRLGMNTFEGQDEFRGHTLRVFYKFENHISWLDGKPYATSPDIIEVIHRDTGEPITNFDIKDGDIVSVVGVRGREPFRTPRGLQVLGPKHFGYDIPYVPIEKIEKF